MLIDSTWRISIPLAIACAAVLALHRLGLPEPGMLAPYLVWVTFGLVAGVSFSLVSAGVGIASAVSEARYRRRSKKAVLSNLQANVQSLSREEFFLLAELLQGPPRFQVHYFSNGWRLIEKGVLQVVGGRVGRGSAPMCEIPAQLRQHAPDILAAAAQARAEMQTPSIDAP